MSFFGKFNTSISHKPISYTDEYGVVHTGYRFANLLRAIKEYRIEHGGDLSVGWEDRVGNKLCEDQKLPACSQFEKPQRKFSLSDVSTFFQSINKWRKTGYEVVSEEESERRAAICAACPQNIKVEGCTSCFRLLQKIKSVIGERTTSKDDELNQCGVCACDLQTKIHLPKHVGQVDKYDDSLPSHCWLKKV